MCCVMITNTLPQVRQPRLWRRMDHGWSDRWIMDLEQEESDATAMTSPPPLLSRNIGMLYRLRKSQDTACPQTATATHHQPMPGHQHPNRLNPRPRPEHHVLCACLRLLALTVPLSNYHPYALSLPWHVPSVTLPLPTSWPSCCRTLSSRRSSRWVFPNPPLFIPLDSSPLL